MRDLVIDSQGRVYVSDRNLGIVLLDSQGRLLRNVGRKGEGPGEYRQPSSLHISPGDSLILYDFDLHRLTVYPPDSSAAARSHTFDAFSGRPARDVIPLTNGESYLAAFAAFRSSDPTQDEPQGFAALVSGAGSIQDMLLTYPSPEGLIVRGDQFVMIASNPFGRSGTVHLSEGRMYYGWTDSLTVGIYDLEATRVGGFHESPEPVPATEADVERAVRNLEEGERPAEMTGRLVDALRAAIPETWPAFDAFLVDERGRIWVDLTSQPEAENKWAIYDDEGERTGAFTMPAGFQGMAVSEDVLYGIETDEFDVPSIVAYQVEPALGQEAVSTRSRSNRRAC